MNYDRQGLPPEAKRLIGERAQVLDAFVSAKFGIAEQNLRLRAGKQVLNWGESTFIQNGLNVINPVNLSLLRQPGSELKEALVASPMLWASQTLGKGASVEAFALTSFDKIDLDPRGSYFSNNDFASPGGNGSSSAPDATATTTEPSPTLRPIRRLRSGSTVCRTTRPSARGSSGSRLRSRRRTRSGG